VADLRLAAGVSADFPRVVFVHMGTVEEGDAFFERYHPRACAVADPERRLFDAFEVERGRLGQLLGPRVLARGAAALARGHGVGKPVGDVKRMPALFLVHDGAVAWRQVFRHAGDKPDLEGLRAAVRALPANARKEAAA
jgi:hypothetical protein